MKVVAAPNPFKGSLGAPAAARAIARGVRLAWPEAEVAEVPVADGGEGTVEALVAAGHGETVRVGVEGPLGDAVDAEFGLLEGGRTAVVELDSVSKRFPGVVANDHVNLRVMPGEVHAVVGENGAGKSTLMKIIAGVEQPTMGRIVLEGEEVTLASPEEAVRRGISMVFQELNLFGNLTVDHVTVRDVLYASWRRCIFGQRQGVDVPLSRRNARMPCESPCTTARTWPASTCDGAGTRRRSWRCARRRDGQ